MTVSIHRPTSPASFGQGKVAAVKLGATAVSGVGDSAYYTSTAGTLQFIAGQTGGSIQVTRPVSQPAQPSAAVQSAAIGLAKTVVAKF
ncbi:hypothetical protein ACSMXN_04050 [Jatrophihabitans sp. DSM 45814]